MAEGRFISRNIAFSEQLGAVSLEADYLFMRMLPHLDVDGRLTGSPKSIKARCCPLRDEMDEIRIRLALAELDRVGLISWYEVDGLQCVEYPNFAKHQSGLRRDREGASKIAAFSSLGAKRCRTNTGALPDDSGRTPGGLPRPCGSPQDIVSEVKGSEVKGSEDSAAESAAAGGPVAEDWPKTWAFDTSQVLADSGVVIATGIVGRHAKPVKDTMPWGEWLRVISRMAKDGAFKYSLANALLRVGEYRDSGWIIGAGGNEAEILAYCDANPVRAAR